MGKRDKLLPQGPGICSSQRHLPSRHSKLGKGSCREWSLGMGVSDGREASEPHLAVNGSAAGKLRGQSFDVQNQMKPTMTSCKQWGSRGIQDGRSISRKNVMLQRS